MFGSYFCLFCLFSTFLPRLNVCFFSLRRMNSYSLAIVGLLCVSAVLAQDFTQFNTNLFDVDSNSAGDSPYWWMSKGSPFKRSFQIAAGGPQQQRFDNQFLNPSAKYSGPGYLPPVQPQPQPSVTVQRPQPPPPPPTPSPRVPCGGNRVCVNRNQCIGGLVDASQVNGANRKPVSSIATHATKKKKLQSKRILMNSNISNEIKLFYWTNTMQWHEIDSIKVKTKCLIIH